MKRRRVSLMAEVKEKEKKSKENKRKHTSALQYAALTVVPMIEAARLALEQRACVD